MHSGSVRKRVTASMTNVQDNHRVLFNRKRDSIAMTRAAAQ